MKKTLVMLLIMVLICSMAACKNNSGNNNKEDLPKVVMVTSEGGLGDESFNDMAYKGIQRAEADFDIEVSVLEPGSKDEYINSLSKAAEQEADLVIAVGDVSVKRMKQIAEQYPKTDFAIVDSDKEIADNVMSLSFKEQEGAFLVGVIAALTTETDNIGFIGGVSSSAMDKYEYGFRAGVKAINPNAQVLVDYTQSFSSPETGKITALSQVNRGADILFHASGESGIGVIEAASDMGIWAIGSGQDQSPLKPETVLCSMFKRIDNAVYLAIQDFVEGKFEGRVYQFGLDFEAVGYIDGAKNLPEDIVLQVDAYKAAILATDIYVPKNRSDFEEFEVPEEGLLLE
ncbi:MAG: BMP family lipoprotein [Anaerovoracaceae bacterium]|jgi:basic membrane protein A